MSLPRRLTLTMPLHAGLSVGHARAAETPLRERGVGIGVLSRPDYRGSDESSFYPIPYPDLACRGTFLKADRRGIRGFFFDNDRVELNVSLNASLPVRTAVTVKDGMDGVGIAWILGESSTRVEAVE